MKTVAESCDWMDVFDGFTTTYSVQRAYKLLGKQIKYTKENLVIKSGSECGQNFDSSFPTYGLRV